MNRDFSQFKRVVVYRIGSLGDTLVVLPAFHLVRQAFPEAHITLLTNVPVNAKAAPMEAVLGQGSFYDDVVRYPISLRTVRGLGELRARLRAGRYDCLVYLAVPKGGVFTSIRDYAFFRSCGIPNVIGIPLSRRDLRCLPIPRSELFVSETVRAMGCLRGLGSMDLRDGKAWDLRFTSEEIGEAEVLLRTYAITQSFLAASVGTKIQPNDWEEHNWAELIQHLATEFPTLPLVLFGASDERERCDRLMQLWKGPKANLCGVTSPRVSAAILQGANVMVCHDSGPMHLAATVDVPCVAIFSARNPPGVWFPRGEQHTIIYHRTPCWGCRLTLCVQEEKKCILSIRVDEVFDAVVQQLARRGISARSESARSAGTTAVRLGLASGVRSWSGKALWGSQLGLPTQNRPTSGKVRVLLIGNYLPDGQQSMQRFATVMEKELAAAGIDVAVIRPEPFFGRLHSGAAGAGKWLGYVDKFFVFPRRLKRRIRELREGKERKLVVHICDHSNAFYARALRDVPNVVTCHDMLAVRSALGEVPQNRTRWSGRWLQKMILRGVRNSGSIVCASDATHRDLCRLVEGAEVRSTVGHMGLNNAFAPVPIGRAREQVLGLVRKAGHSPTRAIRYIVHVGDDSWYKNRQGVVELFSELRRSSDESDLWLMMVGKSLNPELKILIEEAGLHDRVVELPAVSHDDLCAIYSAAELLLFPSLQEGFGWPVIEAQACRCRVVTTDRPPMNDIGGDAAAYLAPEDISSSLDVLLNVLYEDDRQRQARIERGFANAAVYSTRQMVEKYLTLYERVAGASS